MVVPVEIDWIAGSSNGKTAAFGAVNRGSNPCPAGPTVPAAFEGGLPIKP